MKTYLATGVITSPLLHIILLVYLHCSEGESYFVRSVRALRAKAKSNEILDREISAFIGQEAMHSKEHHAFHVSAQQYGLDPQSLEKVTGIVLKAIEKVFSKNGICL
ncbi:metal-dependent hydrolase [Acinetobacter pittii]|nr:metal-dependent hydrolase [Acinetobacter pittii]